MWTVTHRFAFRRARHAPAPLQLAVGVCSLLICCACSDDMVDCPPVQGPAFAAVGRPAWHPSGDFILFDLLPLIRVEFPDGPECPGKQIFDWDEGGLYSYQLATQATLKMAPWVVRGRAWSPTGDRLLLDSGGDIFSVGFDGATLDTLDIRRLTFNGSNHQPVWSPDGRTIAYWRPGGCPKPEPGDSTCGGTFIMDPQGAGKLRVANGYHPSWFPDSRRLAYVGLYTNLFVIDLLDSTNIQLTGFGAGSQISIQDVAVSPDGGTIALSYQAYQKSRPDPNIWAVNPDGSNFRPITSEGTLNNFSWCPDSKRIAYVSYRTTDWSPQNGSLWSIDVETGEKRMIVDGILE